MSKYYVHHVRVTVLATHQIPPCDFVDGIKDALNGDGRLVDVVPGSTVQVSPATMAVLLHDYGNSAELFGLNSDGTPLEEGA
jgi:hypothetical protein